MQDLIRIATKELAAFLSTHLPALGSQWWRTHVEEQLTYPQQQRVRERGLTRLDQLDLAALLRIVEKNWSELSQTANVPREGRNWVRELQTVRSLLALIAELDRREVWAAQGALSCAQWLSWACGIDTHTAREKVRVARALRDLPLLSEGLAKGELGYSKVRALTRIATAGNEADLLNIGLHGTAQHVEKFVRLHRRAKRAEETERADARHENRGLTFWHEDDGTVVVHGRFPPEMGARILSALDAAMTAHAAEQPAAGAASPAAPRPTGSTATTSSTGPTAARPRSATSSFCVRPITGWCTRADSMCSASTTACSDSPTRTGWPSAPPQRHEASSPDTIIVQNESLGLAIDCETATAHWHGERIDYDHALMVTMASWDSGDTRPEAGPAAGDWNPS